MFSTSTTPRISGAFTQSQMAAPVLARRLANAAGESATSLMPASLTVSKKRCRLKPPTVMSLAPWSLTAVAVAPPVMVGGDARSYSTSQESPK